MEKEISELIEYLDQKFTKIESALAVKADKADIQNLLDAIDGYAQKADTFFQEMVMLSHKVDRHEKWIREIAKKLGVELEY